MQDSHAACRLLEQANRPKHGRCQNASYPEAFLHGETECFPRGCVLQHPEPLQTATVMSAVSHISSSSSLLINTNPPPPPPPHTHTGQPPHPSTARQQALPHAALFGGGRPSSVASESSFYPKTSLASKAIISTALPVGGARGGRGQGWAAAPDQPVILGRLRDGQARGRPSPGQRKGVRPRLQLRWKDSAGWVTSRYEGRVTPETLKSWNPPNCSLGYALEIIPLHQ